MPDINCEESYVKVFQDIYSFVAKIWNFQSKSQWSNIPLANKFCKNLSVKEP